MQLTSIPCCTYFAISIINISLESFYDKHMLTLSLSCRLSSYEPCYDESESVTDTSEDSVEVRVNKVEKKMTSSTTPSKKNKRKSMEPRKMMTEASPVMVPTTEPTKRCRLNSTGSEDRSPPVSYNSESRSPSPSSSPSSPPSKESKRTTSPLHLAPKKRFKFDALKDMEEKEKLEEAKSSGNPFRPWSSEDASTSPSPPPSVRPPGVLPLHPFLGPGGLPLLPLDPRLYGYLPTALPPYLPLPCPPASPPEQDEPLCLVKKEPKAAEPKLSKPSTTSSSPQKRATGTKASPSKRSQASLPAAQPAAAGASRPVFNVEAIIRAGGMAALRHQPNSSSSSQTSSSPRTRNDSGSTSSSGGEEARAKQRNYKNMTRERRVEANARERQRVHTITAAFDNLQGAIPTEEENVKLSKLSVIKIATAYIMALSRMAGHDYTEDQSAPPVEEVIRQCSEVIEAESRIKKRSSH